ncbi:fumarylacetoacetate hydrolase [Agrobacterium vitis]|uniref:Fumarylacetoacetate hydrolase family protein n=2 Tax=Agrobacterium vitis TaxID=373 RepID=A0AAE4WZU6_AGRVI|nr:fumarylacetoacetate hydrolase family protein [Agrobacterium vitis]MUO81520.1 fumarylacetoacetate hydrolase [Agrobacterium vitis]MUO95833.1 fumarylacetoacetate hydrolase [Agrobacterium vitis]MVA93912.1 fumarylacetoacetate hydrolase [Agrobacterium vitis]MVB03581.1 fumarylacetoacetate hydrolase [Agrobacterium vitis]
MRFIAFKEDGKLGMAVSQDGKTWKGLKVGDPGYPGNLEEILRAGEIVEAGKVLLQGRSVDLAEIEFLPPVSNASKVICVGLNYADHAAEGGSKVPDYPTVFARFNSSLIGHGAPLVCPKVSEQFDYEAEMVAIIGKGGRAISEAEALSHVAGYSVFNDGSVRDYQLRTPQWTIGKNFDGTGAFGPAFVTADELEPGATGLRIQTRLNGRVLQDASTSDLVFSVARLVSLISAAMTLEPGDVIVTGTPAGVGLGHKPPIFMKEGDVCEIEIEKIGLLSNPVVKEK